jgi:hypothetical protein
VDRLRQITARRILCFSPPDALSYFESLAAPHFTLTPQSEGDLGRRMAVFFSDCFRAGADQVVVMGADSPTVPLDYIERAFQLLRDVDVVVGPAMDGGYYLVGCAREMPAILDHISWSTSSALDATVKAIRRVKCRFALLPPWYDVDTLDDWRMLEGHVAAMRLAGLDPAITHTERLFQQPVP